MPKPGHSRTPGVHALFMGRTLGGRAFKEIRSYIQKLENDNANLRELIRAQPNADHAE